MPKPNPGNLINGDLASENRELRSQVSVQIGQARDLRRERDALQAEVEQLNQLVTAQSKKLAELQKAREVAYEAAADANARHRRLKCAVVEMRGAQKAYFKRRLPDDMQRAKATERNVDAILADDDRQAREQKKQRHLF